MRINYITGFCATQFLVGIALAQNPPANDDCSNASEIYLGTTSYSTIDATTDGDVHSTCQHDGQTYNDIWYGFTAGCDGILVVSTCGLVDYDSDLVVYLGDDCNNLTMLGCNDDGEILGVDCANYSSYLEVPVYMGDRLMIRVGGWNSGDSGSGDILLDIVDVEGYSVDCPANDACIDAVDIVEGATYFTTSDATTDGTAHPTCETGSDGGDTVNDIWYRYSAPASGTLTISTCDQANYDTDLVAYSGTDCNNLFFLGCNDDFENCLLYTSTLVIPVNAGEEYLVRVGGWNGSESGTGTLTLTLDASAVTWVGSPGGSWFDTANWSSGVLPTNAVDVEIDASVVIDQLGATASQVTIQNGGHLAVGVGSSTAGSLNAPITVQSGGTLQLQNTSSSIVSTAINIESGGNLNWFGGTIDVSNGSFTTAGNISVGSFGESTLIADSSTITANTLSIKEQGTMRGYSWCYVSQLNNDGIIEVGGAYMHILVSGDYVQSESGRLVLDLGGVSISSFDRLVVNGSSSIDGTLDLRSLNGYSPNEGDTFAAIVSNNDLHSGNFSSLISSGFAAGTSFTGTSDSSGYSTLANVDTVWFVDANNSTGTGTSWSTAFPTIQAALAVVGDGEQIWIAEGTYTPGTSREWTFLIPNLIHIYGGFEGTETSISERDVNAHPTILSGNVNDTPDTDDDAYHVVTFTPFEWSYSVLDGCTITRGMATGLDTDENYGGGVFIQTGALFINNCLITNNQADDRAGGIYVDGGSVFMVNTIVLDNTIEDLQSGGPGFEDWGGNGGGAYILDGTIVGRDVVFDNNSATSGGGVYATNSEIWMSSCEFKNNDCFNHGAGMYASSGTLELYGSVFDNNRATTGIIGHGAGGGLFASEAVTTIKDTTFVNNMSGGTGGGLCFEEISTNALSQTAFLDRCNFQLNESFEGAAFGAALWPSTSNKTFVANSLFAGNNGPSTIMGCFGSRFTNCTIANNFNLGASAAAYGAGNFENSIVWGNVGLYDRSNIFNQINGSLNLDRCIIDLWNSNYEGTFDNNAVFNLPVIFRSERGPDGILQTGDEDYRVLPDSMAIDFGDNTLFNYPDSTTDLDGNARIQDDPFTDDWDSGATPIIDMGCYEYAPQEIGVPGYRIWNGGSDGLFSDDSDWLPAEAPSINDRAYFSVNPDLWPWIAFNGNRTIRQLEVTNGFIQLYLANNTLTLTETNEASIRVGSAHENFANLVCLYGNIVAQRADISDNGAFGINPSSTVTTSNGMIIRDGGYLYGGGTVVGNVYNSGRIESDSLHVEYPSIIGDLTLLDGSLEGLEGTGSYYYTCVPIDYDPKNEYGKLSIDGTVELGGLLWLKRASWNDVPVYAGLSFTILESTSPIATQFEVIMASGFGSDGDLIPIVSYVNNVNGTGGSVIVTFQTVSSLLGFGDETETGLDTLPADAEFADFTNDGYPDVAISLPGTPSQLLILINGGMSGTTWSGFTASRQIPIGNTSAGLAVGDLDGDGDIDIVVANKEDDTISVIENIWNIDSSIGFTKLVTDIPTDFYGDAATLAALPTDVAIGNFNTPTSIDIAVANSGDGMLAIINGPILSASFMPSGSNYATGGGAQSVDPTDVNDTKDLDKVAVTGADGKTSIFKSGGSGLALVFEYEDPIVIDVGESISEQIIADIDGNGFVDLILADPVRNTIDILLQTAEDVYASPVQIPLDGTNPESITTIDLDGDSDLDLVIILTNETSVKVARVFRNDTEYGSGEAIFTDIGYEIGAGEIPLFVRSADVDGDGADDLWLATATPPSFRSTAVGSTQTALNDLDLGTPCPGDINEDGEVSIDDLLTLIGAWDTNDPDADLNDDGIVNIEDLLLLISSFGACP